ncbi:MAG: glucose-6-phosphate isomerase [Candidatus Omnitrophota bacterium]
MENELRLDDQHLRGFVSNKDLKNIMPGVKNAHSFLVKKNGEGKDMLGWVDLPERTTEILLSDIEATARRLNENSDAIIIIGVGGSYLGARSVIETLSPRLAGTKIFFAGYNLSCDYLTRLLDKLKDKNPSVIVVSKSGTTTEPAVAFRIIESFLERKYGPREMKDKIVCVTNNSRGVLREIADKKKYKSFDIPDDVGGRFSILTPVGLLPIACAGVNIRDFVNGAKSQQKKTETCDLVVNTSYKYAAFRNILYQKGKRIEILASFDNSLHYVDEWWKQLFGESEGKGGHSIFPASCDFSTDLHSMGQLIQEGERNLFETFLVVEKESVRCELPFVEGDLDKLNYLAGKHLDHINKKAYEAAAQAHFEGGVPNSTIFLSEKSAFCLGQLFYFFEKAAAVSGYLAGVNPFNQPGVEAYKNKMFKLIR